MNIYTKTGDKGKTSLFDGTRVSKDNIRLETYGTFDELSSLLGVAQSFLQEISAASGKPVPSRGNKKQETKKQVQELQSIQKDLLDIGACLANPHNRSSKKFLQYLDQRVRSFEKAIDSMTEKLPILTNFILPGGGKAGSFLHLCRTVARRAERRLVALSQKEQVDGAFIRYFNRLSDLLFTMSRLVNKNEKKKETLWTKYKV